MTVESAKVRIANLSRKLENAKRLFMDGDLTAEEWYAKRDDLKARIASYFSRLPAPCHTFDQVGEFREVIRFL